MAYSAPIIAPNLGPEVDLLSSTEVMKILGITKVTLYKWIDKKKIKVRDYKIGSRHYYGFDEKEVSKLKGRMKKNREKGLPLLEEL